MIMSWPCSYTYIDVQEDTCSIVMTSTSTSVIAKYKYAQFDIFPTGHSRVQNSTLHWEKYDIEGVMQLYEVAFTKSIM